MLADGILKLHHTLYGVGQVKMLVDPVVLVSDETFGYLLCDEDKEHCCYETTKFSVLCSAKNSSSHGSFDVELRDI